MGVGVGTMSGMPMLFWEGNFLNPPPPLSASGPNLPPTVRVNPRQTTRPVTCHVSGF